MKNMTFKNRLRFLTLKRLVCLLKFSWKASFQVLSVLKNDGRWNFSRQEESPNPSYHQSKDCSKVDWEDFYDRHCPSTFHLNFNCHSQAQWLSLWAWFFSSTKDYVLGRWNSQGSDCFNREMKMSFIAKDFDKLNIITVLEGRTQTIIRNHFLRYDRSVRCQVKIITMDMFSSYYALAKHLFRVLKSFSIVFILRYYISELRLKQSTGLFYSNT